MRWSPSVEVTPFMRFLDASGMEFRYGGLKDGGRIGFRCFYTCNVSIDRRLLAEHPFDPRPGAAVSEEIGLRYRLERAGLTLHFHRAAGAPITER